jgi:hypothetical protein
MKHTKRVCHKYMLPFRNKRKEIQGVCTNLYISVITKTYACLLLFFSVFKIVITTIVFVCASIIYLSFLRSQQESFSSMFFIQTNTFELYLYICFLVVVLV